MQKKKTFEIGLFCVQVEGAIHSRLADWAAHEKSWHAYFGQLLCPCPISEAPELTQQFVKFIFAAFGRKRERLGGLADVAVEGRRDANLVRLETVGMHHSPTIPTEMDFARLMTHEAVPIVTIAHRRLVWNPVNKHQTRRGFMMVVQIQDSMP